MKTYSIQSINFCNNQLLETNSSEFKKISIGDITNPFADHKIKKSPKKFQKISIFIKSIIQKIRNKF